MSKQNKSSEPNTGDVWLVHRFFEASSEQYPDAPAVISEGQALSYSALNAKANRLAHYLLSVHQGEPLAGICIGRSNELAMAVLAILKAGLAYVPFDPEYPEERLSYMMEVSSLPLIITTRSMAARLPKGAARIVVLEDIAETLDSQPSGNPGIAVTPGSLAYVLFTSGSTGLPKGVAMPHAPLVNLVHWQQKQPGLHGPDRTLQFAPISFDVSFQEMFTTWACGGTLYMIDDELRLNALKLLGFISENAIDRLFLPFIALQHLAEIGHGSGIYPSSLKHIITAGEQLRITPHITGFFNGLNRCRLHNHYGPTETHVVTAYILPEDLSAWMPLPPIGRPVDHTEIHLLDESMAAVATGEPGELYVSGAALARGYLNRDELTAERFLVRNGVRMYRTGDLARLSADGNIEYLGRSDGQVKIRGYRIEPGEIEVAAARYPHVRQVVVAAREDVPGDKRLVAYIIPDGNHVIDVQSLRHYLAASLPEYMVPSAFVMMDAFPRTPSGKIDKRALPAPGNNRPQLSTIYEEPVLPFDKALAAIWESLLRIDRVGIHDNFFDLGGNSLLALQTIAKLHQEHNTALPVARLYQNPTIAGIRAWLDSGSGTTAAQQVWQRQTKKAAASRAAGEGIAVIGMSARFPGAANVREFWKNLVNGTESVTFFQRFETDPSLDPGLVSDPAYVAARGIIADADKFDAAFFGINPRLAELMDPQQRVFLEIAWHALEDAGYTGDRYNGLIGVYAGMGNNTYYPNNVYQRRDLVERTGAFQVMVANEKDYIATRVAHDLNLRGPGVSIHTACSTSLAAVTLAFDALLNHHCDMAIAGGISITSPVHSGHLYQEGGMYSADGHTRTFDAGAQGTVFSDGGGAVVLKRLADAIADGDTVYAVIRGAAMNNDGSGKASFTAPSVEGQSAVIAMAQAMAGVAPESISYIEAHGTATPIGDPIEIEALTQAFRSRTDARQFCAIGSVKSNFGHLTAAAGIAGLIKTVLALKHKQLPPSLNYIRPNPAIDFESSPFYVNNKLSEWKADGPRRAGISSFGVGGTNVHVVVEEAPDQQPSGPAREVSLLTLSAKSRESLDQATENLKNFLAAGTGVNMADAAYTLQTGRHDFSYRRIVTVTGQEDAVVRLSLTDPKSAASRLLESRAPGVVFLFPGQGAQYVNMGSTLYRDEIVFRDAVDRCCRILEPHMGLDLRKILYPEPGDLKSAEQSLKETLYTQPALFTIGYALSSLWMSWGIKPSAFVGHSIGEFAGACLAGVFSLEDALFLVASRGAMMQDLPRGSMLSVRMPAAEIEKRIGPELSVAAVNGPALCVVAGNTPEIEALQAALEKEEVICKPLHTSHAFHSPMMDPIVGPFLEKVKQVKLHAPKIPFVSTVTADWITDAEATDPRYWAGHLRATVRFAEGIQAVWKKNPAYVLLECGPRTTAATLARQQAQDLRRQVAISSLGDTAAGTAEWQAMMFAAGQLWLNGITPDWDSFYAMEKRQRISLPGYAFERKRYWIDPPPANGRTETNFPNTYINEPVAAPVVPPPMQINSSQQMNNPSTTRQQRIIDDLKSVMEESSGIELAQADPAVSFMELGLDSLFLTQAALTISKKYGVKVTFRQLNEEFGSFQSLSAHLDQQMPAGAMPEAAPAPKVQAAGAPHPQPAAAPVSGTPGSMEWMMMQQLQMMQQQLQMMQAGRMPGQTAYNPAVTPAAPQADNSISADEAAELKKPFGAIARIEKGKGDQLTEQQRRWLDEFTARYTARTKKSKAYTQKHRPHLADPRVVTGFKANIKELIYQPVVDRSEGARVWDIDGNEYVDVLNGFGSNMFGHNNPVIMQAIAEQMKKGYELGPQHPLAGEIAEMICQMTGFDRAGFCNTGSEAVLGAMRIARTVTGRSTIVIFSGSYHGINDEVIVRGTKKLRSVPAAAGIPAESVQNVLVLDYGTKESLDIIKSRIHDLAAVMVEPVQSRRADFQPKEFLHDLRKVTMAGGCLLIFDEVITGFRMLPGGAQEHFGIRADVATYGKVIGGGMPIGVIAGKREYMDALDGGMWQYNDASVPEAGVTYFAGTFVRHPFALAAAKASLELMKKEGPSLQHRLNALTTRLADSINAICLAQGAPFHIVHFGSLFKMKWDAEPPYCELIYVLLREKGIHIYDGFPCFLTTAHTDADVDFIIERYRMCISAMQEGGFFTTPDPAAGRENGRPAAAVNPGKPPVPGAQLGKDPDGNPGWFIPDPQRPGKYLQVK